MQKQDAQLEPVVTPGPAEVLTCDPAVDPLTLLGGLIQRYGDTLQYRTPFGQVFLFTHPAHVHSVLHRDIYTRATLVKLMLGDGVLSTDGPGWREQRRLMQKRFHKPRIEPFLELMIDETQRLGDECQRTADSDEPFDLTTGMTRLTLRIVVDALFSGELDEAEEAALCEAITTTIDDLGAISWTVFGVPVSLSPQRNASFNAAKKVVDDTCLRMIARRRDSTDRPDDLLTLLVESEDEDGPLSDTRLRDEMVTMLIGGHETTALSLAWAWQLLADHPEAEARLHDEVDRVIGDRRPTLEDVMKLRWTRAVFTEAMRLYPPVWYMARVAQRDDVIDGHAVPKGSCVLISAYFTQRHPEFWPDPERFDPKRFLRNDERPGERYAFFPFGGGRHQCLGLHFAKLEGVVALALLAKRFRIRPVNSAAVQCDPSITLRQKPNLFARIEPR